MNEDKNRYFWNKELHFGKKTKIILLIVFIVFLGILFSSNNTYTSQIPTQKQSETLDDLDIYIQGQYYVKQVLKSPASAVFPYTDFIVHRLNNNRFEVISYVDSQNSFGALLRSSWNVVFQYQNGKTYLEKMVFDGKVVYPVQGVSKETKQEIEKTQKLLDDLQKEIKSYE